MAQIAKLLSLKHLTICISTSRVYKRTLFTTPSKIQNINFYNLSWETQEIYVSAISANLIIINNVNIRIVTSSAIVLFIHWEVHPRKTAFLRALFQAMANWTKKERHRKTHLSIHSANTLCPQGLFVRIWLTFLIWSLKIWLCGSLSFFAPVLKDLLDRMKVITFPLVLFWSSMQLSERLLVHVTHTVRLKV